MAENASAVVTGASSGIGCLLVRRLVAAGRYARIVVVARRADRLAVLAAEAPAGVVVPVAGDLCDPAFRATVIPRAEAEGPLALLVNNAGYGRAGRAVDMPPDDARRMLELNVHAVVDLTRDAIAAMRRSGGGRILQVSSIAGFVHVPYMAAYCATKSFVNAHVDTLRHELAGSGIRVSAVCPGGVRTEFTQVAFGGPATGLLARQEEPVERVVQGIVRRLDRDRRYLFPTFMARLTYAAYVVAPWLVRLVAATVVRRVVERALPPPAAGTGGPAPTPTRR